MDYNARLDSVCYILKCLRADGKGDDDNADKPVMTLLWKPEIAELGTCKYVYWQLKINVYKSSIVIARININSPFYIY